MKPQQKRQARHLLLVCMIFILCGLLARADIAASLGAEAAAAAAMGAKPASARLGDTIREAFTADTYQQGNNVNLIITFQGSLRPLLCFCLSADHSVLRDPIRW